MLIKIILLEVIRRRLNLGIDLGLDAVPESRAAVIFQSAVRRIANNGRAREVRWLNDMVERSRADLLSLTASEMAELFDALVESFNDCSEE